MSAVEVFRYDTAPIRAVTIDGEPWFIAADVAAVLGYRDAHNAVRLLDDDERGTHLVSTPGGQQRLTVISEPGLYTLTLRSDMSDAKRFRKWVTRDVLPAIRTTGRYESPTVVPALPDMNTAEGQVAVAEMLLELARTRVEQEREIQAQRARLDWAEPRAIYTDRHVDGAHDATTVRDFAKQADVGEKALREWMTKRHLIYKDATNQYKPYAQLGPRRHWFVLKDQPDAPRLHNGQLRQTLYITPAGKVGIAGLLEKYPPEAAVS